MAAKFWPQLIFSNYFWSRIWPRTCQLQVTLIHWCEPLQIDQADQINENVTQ